MSSAWGSSWGSAWGNSWGSITPVPTPGRSGLGGDDVPRRKSPDKGWDKKAYDAKKADEDAFVETLKAIYRDLTGQNAPISVLSRVDAIVKPVAKRTSINAPLRIDWAAMARNEARTREFMRLWQDEQELRAAIEDDDDVLILLL